MQRGDGCLWASPHILPEDFSLVRLAGVSNPTTPKGLKNNLFAVQTNQITLGFLTEFLKAGMSLTNCLYNLKKKKKQQKINKLNFNCQHFEITKAIFHIKIANCWMDKFCNRREIGDFFVLQGSAMQPGGDGEKPCASTLRFIWVIFYRNNRHGPCKARNRESFRKKKSNFLQMQSFVWLRHYNVKCLYLCAITVFIRTICSRSWAVRDAPNMGKWKSDFKKMHFLKNNFLLFLNFSKLKAVMQWKEHYYAVKRVIKRILYYINT